MNRVYIIAEAGVNHNGSLDLAMKLVCEAKRAGADAVKFQTFIAKNSLTSRAKKAEYQRIATGGDEDQLQMVKKLELKFDDHLILIDYCRQLDIDFISTAFDNDSIEFLKTISMPYWKIPSGEIVNLPYLRLIGSLGSPILLSTGMATLGEVECAIDILMASGTKREQITVLHCTTEYPAPMDEVNLKAMVSMGQAFGVSIGYSDHTEGIVVPIAATVLGARVIEKHLTLDKKMEGPDHRASLEPEEFKSMVSGIRSIEVALGHGIKIVMPSEYVNRPIVRKSIVAARSIKKGSVISEKDIITKRPGTGLSPMEWDRIVGSIAMRNYEIDEDIVCQEK